MTLKAKSETISTGLGPVHVVTLSAEDVPFASANRQINGLPADAWLAEKSTDAVKAICAAISDARQVEDKGLSEVLLRNLRAALVPAVSLAGWCLDDRGMGDHKTVERIWENPDLITKWLKAADK